MVHTTNALTTDGHTGDLRDKYVTAKNAVVDLAAEARKTALDRAADLKKTGAKWIQEKGSKVKTQASASNMAVISYVRKNPYKSLAMAAAAGLVLGFVIHRSRRSA